MDGELIKIGAKIQHFYEVMARRFCDLEDASISGKNELERLSYREKCIELQALCNEYMQTFESFLHKKPADKGD